MYRKNIFFLILILCSGILSCKKDSKFLDTCTPIKRGWSLKQNLGGIFPFKIGGENEYYELILHESGKAELKPRGFILYHFGFMEGRWTYRSEDVYPGVINEKYVVILKPDSNSLHKEIDEICIDNQAVLKELKFENRQQCVQNWQTILGKSKYLEMILELSYQEIPFLKNEHPGFLVSYFDAKNPSRKPEDNLYIEGSGGCWHPTNGFE